jgi:protoheme IX farnesyltransferase
MVLYDDYEAGFFMLPTGKRGTALQIILYTVWLILASLASCFLVTGAFIASVAAVVVFLVGIVDAFFTQ